MLFILPTMEANVLHLDSLMQILTIIWVQVSIEFAGKIIGSRNKLKAVFAPTASI